jgi:hypothetical protein
MRHGTGDVEGIRRDAKPEKLASKSEARNPELETIVHAHVFSKEGTRSTDV